MPSALTLGRHWRLTVGLATVLLVALAVLAAAMSTAGQVPLSKHIAAAQQQGHRTLLVGPGPVRETILVGSYRVEVSLTPNRSTSNGIVSLTLTKRGRPVRAQIRLTTTMLTMNMGYTGVLTQTKPGRYMHAWPALGMGGRWRLQYLIAPTSGTHFTIDLIDRPS
jgi:hypothetical protein